MDTQKEFEGYLQQSSASVQVDKSQLPIESTEPVVSHECQDGVCVVVWKPRKPQAA